MANGQLLRPIGFLFATASFGVTTYYGAVLFLSGDAKETSGTLIVKGFLLFLVLVASGVVAGIVYRLFEFVAALFGNE